MTNEQEKCLIDKVRKYIKEHVTLEPLSDEQLDALIEDLVNREIGSGYCSIDQKVSICTQIYSMIRGFGILDTILKDHTITEVMINGHKNIFVEKNGHIVKLAEQFDSEKRLQDVIDRIISSAGRTVSRAKPIVDARLEDGSRVNVVLPPVALCGPTMTIRKFSKTPMNIDRLIELGAITQDIANQLELLVKAKYNI